MTTTNPAPKDNTTFGNFEPKKVLIWLDGPRTFTLLDQDEQLCLAHWLREVGELWQYVVVRVNDNILRELHDGERSLREALQHPIVYLVDVRPDFTVESAHQTAWENLPQDALPMPGKMIRRELELYFRITSMQNDSPEQLTVREQQILECLKDGERHSGTVDAGMPKQWSEHSLTAFISDWSVHEQVHGHRYSANEMVP